MTWYSHKILTGSLVYATTGSKIASIFAAIGSVIPDAIEGYPNTGNYRAWRKHHRQLSHWFVPYITISLLLIFSTHFLIFSNTCSLTFPRLFHINSNSLIYFFGLMIFGAFLHCVEDAFCGTIPSLNPSSRIGIHLFYVRSPKEYFFVSLLSILLVLVRLKFDMY